MATVKPFRGVVYNKGIVKDIARVVAPPYDIIPKAMQNALYRKDPRNVIRLELGKNKAGDTTTKNRYTRARDTFHSWLGKGVMLRDEREALYIYAQEYKDRGKRVVRVGFLGLMGFGGKARGEVKPHENTLAAPKADRLNLMREVKANLSPIFVLFEDPRRIVTPALRRHMASHKPLFSVAWDGERHMIWRMDDPRAVKSVTDAVEGSKLFIADGHHRFETAKNYAAELRKRRAPSDEVERASALMVYFVESDERMLTVLPAHRLPKDVEGMSLPEMVGRLAGSFSIEKRASLASMMKRLAALSGSHAFGMYAGKGVYYVLRLKNPRLSDAVMADKPRAWRRLDVSILHRYVFQHILGIRDTDDNVEFVKDARETAAMVDGGEYPVAFFLNPTKASQVKEIATLGERMPRKATYFYPKPLTGLVINKL